MIHKALQTELDKEHLSRHEHKQFSNQGIDYCGVVVNKPWGYEYLLFKNNHVEIWVLSVGAGHATSMHCHRQKQTSLSVLAGAAEFSTLGQKLSLDPLDGVLISPGTFHQTRAVADGTMVMEVETPPNKSDIVRLKDAYGREDKGYEGSGSISKELGSYAYCYFEPQATHERRAVGSRSFGVDEFLSAKQFLDHTREHRFHLVVALDGKLVDGAGNTIIRPGDILTFADAEKHLQNNCSVDEKLTTLTIA